MKFSLRIQFEQHMLLSLPEKTRKSPTHWVVNQWLLQFQHPKVGLQEKIGFFYCIYKNKRTVNTIEIVYKSFLCSFLIFCIFFFLLFKHTKVTNQLCYFCYNYLSFSINNLNNLIYCIIHLSLQWITKSNIDKITMDVSLNFKINE